MRERKTIYLSAALALLLAAVVAGCGGVPGNAVATVDGDPIEKSTFDHWMGIAAKSTGPEAQVPDAPEFTRCVADKRENQPEEAEGQPQGTDEQLKAQCREEYEALRTQVMQLLITSEWIEGEAEEMDISVSDEEVQEAFDQQKEQAFPKEKDFEEFLETSGQSTDDLMYRVRLDTLSNKIREQVTEGEDQVTDEEVARYYEENKERFAQPETRDVRMVLTRNRDRARQAKTAIENGQGFGQVARRFSIDEQSKEQGGRLEAMPKGQQEKAFDDAVFSADRGELTGPVKTQYGYYVFEVTKVEEASQQTLEESQETIKQLLASEGQQKALDDFVKEFREKWVDKTDCRDEYVTQDCKNAPEPEAEATPTPPGAVPNEAPEGGVVPPGEAPPEGEVVPDAEGAPPNGEAAPPEEGQAPPPTDE
jgi:foldase protein PrsA